MAPIGLAFAVLDILHGSRTELGLVLAARAIPQAVFILLGGVIADRLPRHAVMVTSNVASMATQGAVAALLLTGNAELWEIVVLSVLNGTSAAFFFPASQGIVPQTVPEAMIQQANALLRLALNAANVFGAALGGVLVAAAGPGWAIAIDAASFGAAALFTSMLSLPEVVREHTPNIVRELAEGWNAFRARSWLWSIVAQFSILNAVFVGAFQVLGPVQAKAHYGGARVWGLILGAEAAGLICGGLVMLRARPQRMLLVATFSTLVLALPLLLLAPPAAAATVAVGAFVSGLGLEVFRLLGHDDAAADPRAHALPALRLRRARVDLPRAAGTGSDRPGGRRGRNVDDALRRGGARDRSDAARVRGPRRQGVAKEVTASVFSSRSSR
jgi:MFS family permease